MTSGIRTSGIRRGTSTPIQWHAHRIASLLRRAPAPPPSSSTIVWAVRRDWAVDGTHEFVCPRPNERAAKRQLAKDRAFWRQGPIRPVLSVVRMSAHEFTLHGWARLDCHAPDCACCNDGTGGDGRRAGMPMTDRPGARDR